MIDQRSRMRMDGPAVNRPADLQTANSEIGFDPLSLCSARTLTFTLLFRAFTSASLFYLTCQTSMTMTSTAARAASAMRLLTSTTTSSRSGTPSRDVTVAGLTLLVASLGLGAAAASASPSASTTASSATSSSYESSRSSPTSAAAAFANPHRRIKIREQKYQVPTIAWPFHPRQPSVALCESSASRSKVGKVVHPPLATSSDTSEGIPPYHYERLQPPPRSVAESHAIFGPLTGEGLVERFHFYRRVDDAVTVDDGATDVEGKANGKENEKEGREVALGDVQFGHNLNGHPGIVHGGIISLLFDTAMGWGYEAMLLIEQENMKPTKSSGASPPTNGQKAEESESPTKIVTANLNINYRAPLPEKTRAVVRVYHVQTDGRKVYFRATMESHNGQTLYAEATSLFIKLREDEQ